MKILVTCPPMLGLQQEFVPILEDQGHEVHCPKVTQILSEEELIALVPEFDGWVIGDDPATRAVFEAGQQGRLRAAVKWGIGVDNVDFAACEALGIPITNTPGMFGAEVADLAIGYVIALAREIFPIDRGVRAGGWPKNRGISLAGRTVGVVGFGDIGQSTATRALAHGLSVITWDPARTEVGTAGVALKTWPEGIEECDFLVLTCALNAHNRHMLDGEVLGRAKSGLRLVNVARGPLIDESALVAALRSGHVHSAALDVFEQEPLSPDSYLRDHPLCILGSHNASNTVDAVRRTNDVALGHLLKLLNAGGNL